MHLTELTDSRLFAVVPQNPGLLGNISSPCGSSNLQQFGPENQWFGSDVFPIEIDPF